MQTKFLNRWLMVIALCFLYSLLQAQQVSKVEYFFDIDPGPGNGITINVTPATIIDSTFAFDVSSLSNGLHQVYVRSQDGNNNWSLNYTGSFIKTNGSDVPLTIVKLEYFVDTDPGFGNATNVPFSTTAGIVDSTFDFIVPDNGANTRYLAVRALDSRGQWSLLYSYDVDMCVLYKAKPSFSWIRFSDQFSFIDSSLNNPAHKLLWRFGNLGTDSVSNPQFTFPQGNYFTRLIAGEGCRKDSISLPLFVGLEKYYPDTALAGGDIMMNFYGGGLDTNVVVTLKKGAETITPYASVAYQQQFLSGIFDLHTASAGIYDINLHYPNGYDTVITNGLRVAPTPVVSGGGIYSPELRLEVFGPQVGRVGTVVTQRLVITNVGGMVAKSIAVWSAATNDAGYRPSARFTDFFKPDNLMDYDSIPTENALDSLLGEPYQGKLHGFMIPALNSGQSFVYTYTLNVPPVEGQENVVDFWVGKRMFGSPFEWDCIHAAISDGFNGAGLIPIVGCGFGIAGFGVDFLSGMAGQFGWNSDRSYDNFGSVKPGSPAYGFASAVWGCLPGIKTAQNAGRVAAAAVKVINGVKKAEDIAKADFDYQNNNRNPCDDENDPVNRYRKGIRGRVAADPNGIDGPEGYAGNTNYITGLGKQGYEVFFENLPAATANAQRIYVADTLDKTKFDVSSFELVGFNLADSFFHIPYQRKEFATTLDLRPGMNLLLRVNAKLDTVTGILNYSFLSLDPLTNDTLPLSDLRGFLPPDTNNINGKGSISYVVNYKKNITTNDVVTNKASIVFDNNVPILTNTWLNTIDRTAPTGGITGGVRLNDTTARISFAGTDVGVGIERYKLYVQENNKPYFLLGYVFGDTVRFTGALDSTYSFYAIPYDSLNNFTPKSPIAEYSITFNSTLPVTLLDFDAQKQSSDVAVTWQTTGETNFSRYEVERSLDGNHFEKMGTVPAQSGTAIKSYQFNDVNAVVKFSSNKNLFYRLKMIDLDDRFKYSRTAKIELDRKYSISVYPNPAKDQLFVDGIKNYRSLVITDIAGKTVLQQKIPTGIPVINISTLPDGVYIITLHGNDDMRSIKFIKQK